MKFCIFPRSRSKNDLALAACCASTALILSGCQQYEAKPLNLEASYQLAGTRIERIAHFSEQLEQSNCDCLPSFNLADGISVEEAQTIALFYNPSLRLARLQAGITQADTLAAGLWEDPVFGFDGTEILSSDTASQFGLTLDITIPISGRLGAMKDHAQSLHQAELDRLALEEWIVRGDVQIAWSQWTRKNEELKLARKTIAQIERIRLITDDLEAAGELARVEGRLVRVELAQRQSELIEIEIDAHQSKLDLLRIMGLRENQSIELLPTIHITKAEAVADPIQRLIDSNLRLRIKRTEYQAAEHALRAEIRKQYPDITIGSGYGSEDREDQILFGISLPIPILNANKGGIAQAKAQRALAKAVAETLLEDLVLELTVMQARLEAVERNHDAYLQTIVPMVDEQIDEIEKLADLGEVDVMILLDTVTRAYEVRTRVMDLKLERAETLVKTIRLLGPIDQAEKEPTQSMDRTELFLCGIHGHPDQLHKGSEK